MSAFVEYTDPAVFTAGVVEGWAESETDPTRCHWPLRQSLALIPFRVVEGRPVSPVPGAAVQRGRNGLGRWGENPMADALVTAWVNGGRYVLLVERADGRGWAVPGGAIEPGESPTEAARRELFEETGLQVDGRRWEAGWMRGPVTSDLHTGEPRFVPDPRGSDEAWAVTVLSTLDLGDFTSEWALPGVAGMDDARRALWVTAQTFDVLCMAVCEHGGIFPAHLDLLEQHLNQGPESA